MLIKFAPPLILLTGTTCEKAPPFPEVPLWETARNPETGEYLCGEYKLTDPRNLTFTPVVDHSISQCEGVFGFKTKDFPTIIDWMKAVEEYYENKLKECGQ